MEATVAIVTPPPGVARGWDLADAETEGWDVKKVKQWITDNADTMTEPDTVANGFEFVHISDLVKAPVATSWLTRGLLTQNCLACLFGDSGTLKSFLGVDLGASIASGKKFLNEFANSKPGPVFYVAGEGGPGYPARIQAWLISRNIANPEKIPFFVSRGAAYFLDRHSAEAANEAVEKLSQQYGSPVLIIVDTLSRNFGPGDENSTADMTAFVGAMDTLKTKFNCSVLLIHHSGLADKSRGRGSSVLRGALDFEYKIERGKSDDVLTVSCTKAKDCEPPAPFSFIPRSVDVGWTDPETNEGLTSITLELTETSQAPGMKLTKARKVALDALKNLYAGEGVHVDIWKNAAYEAGISSSEDTNAKWKAFKRAKNDLMTMQLVECNDDYCKPL